jgi:hypothetical protein
MSVYTKIPKNGLLLTADISNNDGDRIERSTSNSAFTIKAKEDRSIVLTTNGKEWTFDNSGNITLPENGDILKSNGDSIISVGLSGTLYTGNVIGNVTGNINKVTITAPTNSAILTIANQKTITFSNTLTFAGTDSSSIAFGSGGTVAYTANKLSVFAATSSSELASVISDETGSGALVFANSPTLSGTPLAPTATTGTNTTQIATTAFVKAEIATVIDSAPTALDTLNELAAALGDDANYAATITTALGTKAPINSPTFTGTVSGITASMVGLGNVTNESKSTMFTSPTFTGTTTLQQTVEKFISPSISANAVTIDFNTGAISYLSSNASNITANFTNIPTTANQSITVALVIAQGGTSYIPSAVNINGASQTIKWLGGSAPSGTANKVDVVTFTFICTSTSTYTVVGSLSTYG